MAIRKRHDELRGMVMFLSFVTAALLVGLQSWGLLAESKPTPIAQRSSSKVSSSPSSTPSPSPSAAAPASAPTAPLQVGIADILSTSLQPVALIQQPQLVVDLSQRQVSLYQNGRLQISYDIAVGQAGWETPSGQFQVLNMQKNPPWQNPITGETVVSGADNPLGSRWIGFWTDGKHQIGFHGTNQEELIGQAVSHGCIRMRDRDIQALYQQVALGTPVMVQP